MSKILFVCTGNTCRSPMAEAIFNKFSSDGSRAESRGTNVFALQPMNPKSASALLKYDIPSGEHLSKQLVKTDVDEFDMILTMSASQKMLLKSFFPMHKSKIFTLNEKAYGKDSDIDDPFGQSQEVYDSCCKEIMEAVKHLLCLK